jgi:hypothetical protein
MEADVRSSSRIKILNCCRDGLSASNGKWSRRSCLWALLEYSYYKISIRFIAPNRAAATFQAPLKWNTVELTSDDKYAVSCFPGFRKNIDALNAAVTIKTCGPVALTTLRLISLKAHITAAVEAARSISSVEAC